MEVAVILISKPHFSGLRDGVFFFIELKIGLRKNQTKYY
jgi:hypothetical protein